jgi:CheY-like chemotaxis protein
MVLDHSCIPAVVLIVEDEMVLRMRAVDMVEDAGYTPLEALDAAEAVAILESRSDVALMCTDIQMPGPMDGVGLAHAVHERWPTIRIIVVSGQLDLPHLDLPPPQQVSRQAAQCRGSNSRNARHDRLHLRRQRAITPNMAQSA